MKRYIGSLLFVLVVVVLVFLTAMQDGCEGETDYGMYRLCRAGLTIPRGVYP